MRKRVAKARINDPQGLRNRVLDVAAVSFQRHGYSGTSIQDIVREANTSGGALAHHFPTKKEIALAVIAERVGAEIGSTWVQKVEAAASVSEGIVQVFEDVISQLDRAAHVTGCPLNNLALELSLADKDFRGAIAHEYDVWRRAIERRIRAEMSSGSASYAGGDPSGFATYVVALFSGAITIAKAEQRTIPLKVCLAQLKRVIAVK
ncbi:MAG: TetR/AcrR family transcriptional regulator [Proteobacteria bacterium]|nr:TetR/AcrR family transcriptional regulator [Pseudomonadota bacterium]